MKNLRTDLVEAFKQVFAEGRCPDWAWQFPPSIPFVGRNYEPGSGVMVYASAEALNEDHERGKWPRFQGEVAWDRYHAAYQEPEGNAGARFFPDVGIQPAKDGGLLAAAWIADSHADAGSHDLESPRRFLDSLAVGNFCKFSWRCGKKSRDYIGSPEKVAFSLPYVRIELRVLRPRIALIPHRIAPLHLEELAKELPDTQFVLAPQFQYWNLRRHLRLWDTKGEQLCAQHSHTALANWVEHVTLNDKNINDRRVIWRYLAAIQEGVRKAGVIR